MGLRTMRQGLTPETRLLPAPPRRCENDSLVRCSFLRKHGRLLSHLREHDSASLAFGCRKTLQVWRKASDLRKKKRVGGLRRCEVEPLRAFMRQYLCVYPFNSLEGEV